MICVPLKHSAQTNRLIKMHHFKMSLENNFAKYMNKKKKIVKLTFNSISEPQICLSKMQILCMNNPGLDLHYQLKNEILF